MYQSQPNSSSSTTIIAGDVEIFTSTDRKWKKRHCVIIRSSQFSTNLKLYVFKSATQASLADASLAQPFRNIHGVSPSSLKNKSSNGVVLTCNDDLVILALDSIINHLNWMDTIKRNVSDVEVRVQLVKTEACRLAVNTQGRLHVQKSRLCYYTEPADACKHLAVWELNRVRRYYLQQEKTFVFESKAKCDTGKTTSGRHYFESEQANKLYNCVHAVCCNKLFRSEVSDPSDAVISSGLTPPLSSSHPATAVANLYHQRLQQQHSIPAPQQHQRQPRRCDSVDYNSTSEDHNTVFNFENPDPQPEQPDRDRDRGYYNLRDRTSYVSMSDVHPLPPSLDRRRQPAADMVDGGYVLSQVRYETQQEQQQQQQQLGASGTLQRPRLQSQLSSGAAGSPSEAPTQVDAASPSDRVVNELEQLATSLNSQSSPPNLPLTPENPDNDDDDENDDDDDDDDPDSHQYDEVAADTPPRSLSPSGLSPATEFLQPPRQKNRPAPLTLHEPLARPAYNRSQSDGQTSLLADPNSSGAAAAIAAAAAAAVAVDPCELRSPTMRTRGTLQSASAIASATSTRAQKPRHGDEYISRQRLQSSSSETGGGSPPGASGGHLPVSFASSAPGHYMPVSASLQSGQLQHHQPVPLPSFPQGRDYVNLRPQSVTGNSYFGPSEPRLQYAQLQHPDQPMQAHHASQYESGSMLPPAPMSLAAIQLQQQQQQQQLPQPQQPQQQPQPPPSQFQQQQQQHFLLNYTQLDRQKTKAFQDIAEEREARRNPASRSTSSASVNGVKQMQSTSAQQLQQQQRVGIPKIKT